MHFWEVLSENRSRRECDSLRGWIFETCLLFNLLFKWIIWRSEIFQEEIQLDGDRAMQCSSYLLHTDGAHRMRLWCELNCSDQMLSIYSKTLERFISKPGRCSRGCSKTKQINLKFKKKIKLKKRSKSRMSSLERCFDATDSSGGQSAARKGSHSLWFITGHHN